PRERLRRNLELPEVSERDVVRHYTRLSQLNFAVDTAFYPLGSCTMKYNPKVNEVVARLPGFAQIHPYQDPATVQGALQLMYELQQYLGEIAGLPAVSLQPAAGAQGELSGMLMVRAHHLSRGDLGRRVVIVPDSAHGTNPATATMCGYEVVPIPSDARGNIDLGLLRARVDKSVAALMITNPNTLGLFEEHIQEVNQAVHRAGGLVYGDGANMNALLGIAQPGRLGFDILHFNLHKTFSTPHGGGGPGAGALAVSRELEPYLPVPLTARRAPGAGREGEQYYLDYDRPQSIGKVCTFYGNFGNLVRAYAYIRSQGPQGLRAVSEHAVLNANYLLSQLRDTYEVPYDRACLHEFVLSGRRQAEHGVRTLDIAKRLLDFGFYAPTIYFPLIVEEALMIEPTETESRETLDAFAAALHQIAREAEEEPQALRSAPHRAPTRRLDEVGAARRPNLRWRAASGLKPQG
ncbi:MAG: aminomethyl-transferring glycine dehydrogenase subunit GcvPB, partial [Chloroflexi bacterium]|nr:aminomethyl-transferring glycine dehydrogenase subunit GcvPB [Chloroflexota bacterium]